uniref:Uncharacterized protein n=1 Tax=Eutreptiella gymnastica TaxID=73025 RepID=A0A7S1IKH8_9EUGL
MALAVKKEWPVVPATAKFADAPAEWPSPVHAKFATHDGPSENQLVQFMRASRLRSKLWFAINPSPYTEAASATKEVMRRQALAGNLWYLPEQAVVRDTSEALFHRTEVLTVKGVNNGLRGIGFVRKNPVFWGPAGLLGFVWAYRWASTGTI